MFDLKTCKKCNVDKNKSEFWAKSGNKDGLMGSCRDCESKHRKNKVDNIKYVVVSEKQCISCLEIKKSNEFCHSKNDKDGLRSKCKVCLNKTYNPDKKREYHLKNEKRIKSYRKDYYNSNKKIVCDKVKEYAKLNRTKINSRIRERYNTKLKYDINFKLKLNLRISIRRALKKNIKSGRTIDILGCSVDEFKMHLESKFTKDMSWDNHGTYGWHIDHIIPISLFDLNLKSEQEKCFHYTNMQPLWATTEIAIAHGESADYIGNLEKFNNIISVD